MRTITCFGDRKLRMSGMCCHPRWPALEVRAAIVSYINSSFLAKFRFPVREYMRRCNVVEQKIFTFTKVLVCETELSSRPRDRGNYFESTAVRLPKQVIVLILIFL